MSVYANMDNVKFDGASHSCPVIPEPRDRQSVQADELRSGSYVYPSGEVSTESCGMSDAFE